jgi:hypothetical protein
MNKRFFAKTKLAETVRPGMVTPCLEWQAGRDKNGYGKHWLAGKTVRAHRVAWELAHGPIPDGMGVLHRCDNPPCVADEHLFLGTNQDNTADRDAKGRQARGDANGARLYPERLSRGEAHSARLREVIPRGDMSWSRLHPERLARGDAHGSRKHPESRPRGEAHGRSKLTEDDVLEIFRLHAQGWSQCRIAAKFGVHFSTISDILLRKIWAHVDLSAPRSPENKTTKGTDL